MSTQIFDRLRFTVPLLLIFTAASVHAAEEPAGQLSKEATAAGPAVDTSKTDVTAPSANQPATTTRREGGPQQVTRAANDRLNLDTTVVTGNRELPKVLYIVPWKKSDLGDLPAQPFNT